MLALALPAGSKFKRAMSDLIAERQPHGPGSGELEVPYPAHLLWNPDVGSLSSCTTPNSPLLKEMCPHRAFSLMKSSRQMLPKSSIYGTVDLLENQSNSESAGKKLHHQGLP